MENLYIYIYIYYMSIIEVVDVNNETKTEEAPINNEVVEQNETVNEEPTPEEVKPEDVKPEEVIPEPKAKAKALPRTKKEVELVQCEHCSKKMTLLRHSHPKNCKGAPTELLPVKPQQHIRKIKPEVEEKIKNEIKQEVIKETIKKPTATELLNQHYEELKQKKNKINKNK